MAGVMREIANRMGVAAVARVNRVLSRLTALMPPVTGAPMHHLAEALPGPSASTSG